VLRNSCIASNGQISTIPENVVLHSEDSDMGVCTNLSVQQLYVESVSSLNAKKDPEGCMHLVGVYFFTCHFSA
jgi:hypothetical protein